VGIRILCLSDKGRGLSINLMKKGAASNKSHLGGKGLNIPTGNAQRDHILRGKGGGGKKEGGGGFPPLYKWHCS